MSKKVFESLSKSIHEAGAIMRGERLPSREFVRERPHTNRKPEKLLAICVETDDDELLIPGKIYEVEQVGNRFAVHDEVGETVLCPTDFFVPVKFEPNLEQLLRQIVS